MNLRFTIYDLRFTILFLLAGTLQGATYYVGPSATGAGTGADRSNLMSLAAFRDTTSAPDDIALLQPGSYGTLTLNPTTGTNLGTSGHPIIYRADAANFDDVFTSDGFTDVNTGDYFNFNLNADFRIKTASPARGAYEYEAYLPVPPTAATNPSPADGAINQPPTVTLSWTTGGNSPTHHMFFGTVLQDVANGTGGTDKGTQTIPYSPGTLAVLTSYHWRVQEENADGNEPGTVWDFTTRPAYLIGGTY